MVGSPCSMRLIINIIEIRMRHDGKQRRDDSFFVSTGGLGKGVMEERLLGDDTSNKF